MVFYILNNSLDILSYKDIECLSLFPNPISVLRGIKFLLRNYMFCFPTSFYLFPKSQKYGNQLLKAVEKLVMIQK